MSLSDKTAAHAKAAPKPYRLFDGDGLYLEISPTPVKYWRLKAETEKVGFTSPPRQALERPATNAVRSGGSGITPGGISPSASASSHCE